MRLHSPHANTLPPILNGIGRVYMYNPSPFNTCFRTRYGRCAADAYGSPPVCRLPWLFNAGFSWVWDLNAFLVLPGFCRGI